MSLGYSGNVRRNSSMKALHVSNTTSRVEDKLSSEVKTYVSLMKRRDKTATTAPAAAPASMATAKSAAKPAEKLPPPPAPEPDVSHHFVFGTATQDLEGDDGVVVAQKDERLMFVYPMKHDSESGTVKMRLKKIDAQTAEMSYHWVTVYSGFEDDVRLVDHFSFVP